MPAKVITAILPGQDEIKELLDCIDGLRYNLHLKQGELEKCKLQLGIELNGEDCMDKPFGVQEQIVSNNSEVEKEENTMKAVNLTVYGADKLAEMLDDVDGLVLKLRRKLVDLDGRRLELEAHLNHIPSLEIDVDSVSQTLDSGKTTE